MGLNFQFNFIYTFDRTQNFFVLKSVKVFLVHNRKTTYFTSLSIFIGNKPDRAPEMNTEVLVDALPYFDAGFDDKGVRETVRIAEMIFVYIFHDVFKSF